MRTSRASCEVYTKLSGGFNLFAPGNCNTVQRVATSLDGTFCNFGKVTAASGIRPTAAYRFRSITNINHWLPGTSVEFLEGRRANRRRLQRALPGRIENFDSKTIHPGPITFDFQRKENYGV